MKRTLSCLTLAAAALLMPATYAQTSGDTPPSHSGFSVLEGRWVRPDGGYVITIKGIDASGKLDAMYANPRPLPFAKAEAARDGKTIRLFFELTAGGYNGSTYTLTYDPVNDTLEGEYYQAVARQKFDIYFTRAK
jgi:hypothetical protein